MEMNEMWGNSRTADGIACEKERFFREAKYAMFIHWGLYSAAGNLWCGHRCYGIGEWLMWRKKIPVAQYESLTEKLNVKTARPSEWVQLAVDAGMRYLVFTGKHHDGFALFQSRHPYNVCDRTAEGRDIVAELAGECRRQGIGLGIYYSQFQDWHEMNSWDETAKMSFDEYFQTKCLPQVRELLSNYGKLAMIWFDTPGNMSAENSRQLVDLIRELQGTALINSRIGNGVGDYITLGDQQIPVTGHEGLWESIDTTNDSWGYVWADSNFISGADVLHRLVSVVARGGNYMLNIGPDGDGNIPPMVSAALRRSGMWLKKYGRKVIYGAAASPFPNAMPWGDFTRRGKKLYAIVRERPYDGMIRFPSLGVDLNKVISRGSRRKFVRKDQWIAIAVPGSCNPNSPEVFELEFKDVIPDTTEIGSDGINPVRLEAEFAVLSGDCIRTRREWMEKFGEWKHQSELVIQSESGAIRWSVNFRLPGFYAFYLEYGNPRQRAWKIVSDEGEIIHCWSRDAGETPNHQFVFRRSREGVMPIHQAGIRSFQFLAEDFHDFEGIPENRSEVSIRIRCLEIAAWETEES